MDDSVSEPSVPPTLAREERLDPLNALNTRSLIVRLNTYRNVAAGPYFNMGGTSGSVVGSMSYVAETGIVTVTTEAAHKLWIGARVRIEDADDPRYEGTFEVVDVHDYAGSWISYFTYQIEPGLQNLEVGHANYRVISGVDYLAIEDNHIQLLDLDETEFAIKEYPVASSASGQTYRAYGIVVADNGLSTEAGPHTHRQVLIRNNKIRYTDGQVLPTMAGIGAPAGGGMQLAGIAQVQVTNNVVDLNASNPMRTFRCGTVRFFNNRKYSTIIPGWKWDVNGHYDEPETLAEDAFIMWMLQRRRG